MNIRNRLPVTHCLRAFTLLMVVLLSACSPRGEMANGYMVANGSIHRIWVASFRHREAPSEEQNVASRPTELRFESHNISVPATHQPGQIEWPKGKPSAFTDFVTIASKQYTDSEAFSSAIAASDQSKEQETFLFVHGFNFTHGEAVYQLAQMTHDFEIPAPAVLFSWPSAAVPAGYLYDRDSALFSRDKLEQVILALTKDPGRRLILGGHSMGNLLIMETLRQIELSGSLDIANRISALFLISPDIDGELFQTQVARMRKLPQPFYIAAARQDRALRLSALLTGKTERLGSQTDRRTVKDLPITVLDVSDLGTGGLEHNIAMTSPAAISILKRLRDGSLLPLNIGSTSLHVLRRFNPVNGEDNAGDHDR